MSTSATSTTSTTSSEEPIPPIPRVIANYWLEETLGAGYSGSIYRARHLHTGQVVALKIQHVNHECPTNRYERGFYPTLQGGKGMPRLWATGIESCWDYLAIDLLGPSLDNLYKKSGKDTMDLRSVCCIAMQVISRLEFMHTRGILHRDIQLGNCVIGLPPNERIIYMIDFGFSKRYIDPYTHRHIADSKAKRDFIGNYWFSSVGVHCRGKVPSRRDDLEAAALMFIHLLTARGLPWTRNGVPKTDAAHDILKREKQHARPEDLCRGMPSEFEEFLRYCRRLKFQDCPDYSYWVEQFRDLAVDEGYPASDEFVWPPPEKQKVHRLPRRSQAPPPDDMLKVLEDLKQLDIGKRPVLGDRSNVEEAVRKAKEDAERSKSDGSRTVDTDPSDEEESDDTVPPPFMTLKAYKLSKLTSKVSKAIDNRELAQRVHEFVAVMKSNTSRTLTKDGFGFLDALHKQLGDPSVFIEPMRTSRSKDKHDLGTDRRSSAKLGVVARLREEVTHARNNRTLAAMVQDFGNVTNRSTGRTVTKDGFAFLEGLAKQLEALA
ncbi:dual specificity kinase 1 [Moniliophthora roreri MCA 2997]|uniref:Dual specificity kinase 1 n=1 Tax=Moniliophthora roreri (strain MCA 2997) TaxID=1381753 RepID=V2XQ38_MONRO|nr:dual specificity kinase 1 [Moniliophthora roreri MCA 2997]